MTQALVPFIYVENWFLCLMGMFWPILIKLCIQVDINEEWFGIIDG